ncbi:MAG: DUF1073 domain-containing protein [Campylobacterota bacterium]|nr:DUF1073 domain-containing protein [Campylobacterota bacterium]
MSNHLGIQKAQDSFQNINKDLGTSKDPRQGTFFIRNQKIDNVTANNLYSTNWLASNIVDIPADETIKKWRELNIEDESKLTAFENEEKRLNVKGNFAQALKWADVFGGAVIIMIIEGQDLKDPLLNIPKGSLKRLITLDRWEITANPLTANILDDNFGKPQSYIHSESGQTIHHSRILKFNGNTPTIREMRENNYWGLSIYEKLLPAITDSMTSSDLINGLLYESNIDVYKLKGLNDLVGDGQDDLATKRIQLAHQLKSTINGIALDSEDGYEKKFATFAGLADIDTMFLQKVSAARKIPITKLLGTSAKGLNATGEGDLKNYYDEIAGIQEREYNPHLDTLDRVMSMSLFGSEIEVPYEFKDLNQLTEKEQADLEVQRSVRDNTYLINGVIDADIALKELNSNKTYGDITEYIENDSVVDE